MKNLTITFLTIVFCLTSSIAFSETVKPEFLKERNGIIYKKKVTNKPYSGYVEGKKENGFLVRGTYQNGKKEGIWKTYDWDVQLWTKKTFKDGKLDGVSEIYYDNGRLENKVNYKNGKMNGLSEFYDDKGQLRFLEIWKNGKQDGVWEEYRGNGQLAKKETYQAGKRIKEEKF